MILICINCGKEFGYLNWNYLISSDGRFGDIDIILKGTYCQRLKCSRIYFNSIRKDEHPDLKEVEHLYESEKDNISVKEKITIKSLI